MRDRYERKHRRTASHPEAVSMMANANFDAVPSLAEVLSEVAREQEAEDYPDAIYLDDAFGGGPDVVTGEPLQLDDDEMNRPMTDEEFAAYDAWVSQCEAEWLATRGMLPPY